INYERVVLAYDASGKLELFSCKISCTTASSWTDRGTVGTTPVPSSSDPIRPFYAAYEQTSGKLVIAYDKAGKATSSLYYKTYYENSLSSESSVVFRGAGTDVINYIRMASKIGSNEITLVMSDGTLVSSAYVSYAFIWNSGTATFGNQQTISASIGATPVLRESIAVAYERSSGASAVFSVNHGASAGTINWYRWNGSTWTSKGNTTPDGAASTPTFVIMQSNPVSSSNKIMICEVDTGGSNSAFCGQEDNGTFGSWASQDTGITGTATRGVDFAWNPSGDTGISIVDFGGSGGASYRTWTASTSTWGALTSISGITGTTPWVQAATNPTDADSINSLWSKMNSLFDIGSIKYTGSGAPSVVSETAMTSDTGVTTFEGQSIAFQLSTATPNVTRALSSTITVSPAANKGTYTAISDSFSTTEYMLGDHNTNLAAMAYRSNTASDVNFPKYREWSPSTSTWGSEVKLPDAGSPVRFAWIEFSPVSAKRVIVTLSDDGFLDSYVCDNLCTHTSAGIADKWTVTNNFAQIWTSDPGGASRPFDMKFEQTSGNLVIVYDKASGNEDLFYRIMSDSATSFGSEGTIDVTGVVGPVVYKFIRMD